MKLEQYRNIFGRLCYEEYKKSVGGKTWNGEDMKTYEQMKEIDKSRHWDDASMGVVEQVCKMVLKDIEEKDGRYMMDLFKAIVENEKEEETKDDELFEIDNDKENFCE